MSSDYLHAVPGGMDLVRLKESFLYHELTDQLLSILQGQTDPIVSQEGKATAIFYVLGSPDEGFPNIKFFNPVRLVDVFRFSGFSSIDLLNWFKEKENLSIMTSLFSAENNKDAYSLLVCFTAELHLLNKNLVDCRACLDVMARRFEDSHWSFGLTPRVSSEYHRVCSMYYKATNELNEFYKSSVLYLTCTPMESIQADSQIKISIEIAIAALLAKEVYDFGELLQQPILACLGADHWLVRLLQSFDMGRMNDLESEWHHLCSYDPSVFNQDCFARLHEKMAKMSFLELVTSSTEEQDEIMVDNGFVQNVHKSIFSFELIKQACSIKDDIHTELFLLKCMSSGLAKGKIDQTKRTIVIESVRPRAILDKRRLSLLRKRVSAWEKASSALVDRISESSAFDLLKSSAALSSFSPLPGGSRKGLAGSSADSVVASMSHHSTNSPRNNDGDDNHANHIVDIKCSMKHNIGVYIRAGRQFLMGTIGKEGETGKRPVDVICFSGLGNAINCCVAASSRLEADKIAVIEKVETSYPEMKGEVIDRLRGVPQMRITLRAIPEARSRPSTRRVAVEDQ